MMTIFVQPVVLVGQEEPNATPGERSANSGDPVSSNWEADGWPLVQTFCLDCHNAENAEAELKLEILEDSASIANDPGAMKRILEMVRFGAMPPEDADQPTEQQRKTLVTALDQQLFANSCDTRPRAGRVTARRLNRAEYQNSIRDLFGIEMSVTDRFPADEVGAGFDNNGDVLSLSPILMEKYLEAAEQIAEQVIVDPSSWPKLKAAIAAEKLYVTGEAKLDDSNAWFLSPDSAVWIEVDVPADGRYMLSIRGGRAINDDQRTTLAIYGQSGKLLGVHKFKYFGGKRSSTRSEKGIRLQKGKQRLYFEQVEQSDSELEVGVSTSSLPTRIDQAMVDIANQRRASPPEKVKQGSISFDEFPFLVRQVTLVGPREYASTAFPDHHNRVVRSQAKFYGGRWRGVPEAAEACLKPLMRRVFRSPVDNQDVDRYVDLVVAATERGESYFRGLQIAITGMLVSPRFLFRIESPPDEWESESDQSIQLTPHQLATRLSYFLWSSTLDEDLLATADRGPFDETTIIQQVNRMLDDPKADSLASQFAAQWLGLRNLEQHQADRERFAAFTASLRFAMQRETELLFLDMVRNNRPITEMLDCDFTFVNGELARHYGIAEFDGNAGVTEDDFRRVSLSETNRRGVLSHASVLTLTSNPGRTSPVKRGKWILENILGTPPPDPPPGVPELEDVQAESESMSLREQLEFHRRSPTCASCHKVMDQLGFGLERFDPIGQFRGNDENQSVDATGELPGGRVFDGNIELTKILAESESDAFALAVVQRLMTFALGRELSPADRCTAEAIVESNADNHYRWRDLIISIVQTRQFQYYDRPADSVE